jgi:DHA1 family multidrug resistance protein-like MFS transporter
MTRPPLALADRGAGLAPRDLSALRVPPTGSSVTEPGEDAAPPAAGGPAGGEGGHGLSVPELLRRPQMWGFVATTASVEFCRGALFLSFLPAYLPQRLGVSVAGVGVVIAAQYLADTVCKIPAGWLVDRFGPWRTLLPFLSLAAVAVYLLPRAHSLLELLLLALLFGLGTSANWPAVLAGSVHLSGLASRASATSIPFLAWLAAGGIGPVLISFLMGWGYALPLLLLALVATAGPAAAVLGVSGLLRRPVDPPWSARRREREEGPPGEWRESLSRAAWLIPGMYVQMLALGMLMPVLVPFARQALHLSQPQYGLVLLAGGAVTVLCLLPAGRLVDRVGSKSPLVVGFLLAGVAVLLVAQGHDVPDLLWRVATLGFAYALILPAWNALTVGQIDAHRRGLLLGVFMTIEGIGETTGPVLGGWLYTHVGTRAPFAAAALVLITMAVFYLVVPARAFRARQGADRGR